MWGVCPCVCVFFPLDPEFLWCAVLVGSFIPGELEEYWGWWHLVTPFFETNLILLQVARDQEPPISIKILSESWSIFLHKHLAQGKSWLDFHPMLQDNPAICNLVRYSAQKKPKKTWEKHLPIFSGSHSWLNHPRWFQGQSKSWNRDLKRYGMETQSWPPHRGPGETRWRCWLTKSICRLEWFKHCLFFVHICVYVISAWVSGDPSGLVNCGECYPRFW